jgi:hypothetical protein
MVRYSTVWPPHLSDLITPTGYHGSAVFLQESRVDSCPESGPPPNPGGAAQLDTNLLTSNALLYPTTFAYAQANRYQIQ